MRKTSAVGKFVWAATLIWVALLPANAAHKPEETFLCQGNWDGQQEVFWIFGCDGKTMTVRFHPNRCQFLLDGEPLGWSELIPTHPTPPVKVSLYRNGFRWLLITGRRLIAFAFADLIQTTSWSGAGIETLQPASIVSERFCIPSGKWKQVELEDGSIVFGPTEQIRLATFPLTPDATDLTDVSVTLPVQPNGARSIGVGVCWGNDGGYLWRWVRRRGEATWQLAIAKPSDSGWELATVHEEPASVSPIGWHHLQVWRSGDQIWAGVDGEVLTQVRDNRFGLGQIVIWVESGDLPQPLIKPVKLNRWWCAAFSPDVDTYIPFPTLLGRWQTKPEGWTLVKTAKHPFALALLGTPDLPSWWIADVSWQGKPIGLVFGWLNEKHYHLLRLRPLEKSETVSIPHSVLEIVAVRDGREKVLDEWKMLLERNKLYRMAVQLTENRITGFVNGLSLVSAEVSPVGKVGLWANSSLTLHRFWLHTGGEQLVSLSPEDGGILHPVSAPHLVAHEMVSLSLPAGLPPNVPLSAKLSQEPVTLFVERRGQRLLFRLERQSQLLGVTLVRLPHHTPITIRMERRDRLLLIWLDNQPVWTVRLP
ncbi:MAG: hypothetical protein N2116_00730 [Armatimonadetes bacterium]|nr:hypothetical protein [Armatimonadota bacterium]